MCGFVLVLTREPEIQNDFMETSLKKLKNRGPDCEDYKRYLNDRIWLGHTRLSINDLSSAGTQPMASSEGNVLIFNGEVYNYKKLIDKYNLRSSLKSSCDTEVLLSLLNTRGIHDTLSIINGMYAFAYYQPNNRTITLAIDIFGEKPIYYYKTDEIFIASSQIDVLISHSKCKNEINEEKIDEYLRYGYIYGKESIYKNIFRLEQSEIIQVNTNNLDINVSKHSAIDYRHSTGISHEPNTNEIKDLLIESLSNQLSCDANKGLFLSSGTDSSLIASIAKRELGAKIPAFTASSDVIGWDESNTAHEIAKSLGIECQKVPINTNTISEYIDIQPTIFHEPFADLSQIATYEISKSARKQNISVLIGGDGADELFGGYRRLKYAKIISIIDKARLKNLAFNISSISYNILNNHIDNQFVYRLEKLANLLKSNFNSTYLRLSTTHPDIDKFLNYENNTKNSSEIEAIEDLKNYIAYMDIRQYLPWNNMVKVDRSCMINSVECRSPFLDKNLVAKVLKYNIKSLSGKKHLKKLLCNYLDKDLIYKRKKGFGIPIQKLISGEILSQINDLYNSQIQNFPYLNKLAIKSLIEKSYYSKISHLEAIFLWKILILFKWKSIY